MDRRIVIDGNDGTGKSTLVRSLRLLGYTNAHDRGEMSEATLDPSVKPAPDTTYILLTLGWQVCKARLIVAGRDMTEKWHTDAALRLYDQKFRKIAQDFDAHVIESRYPSTTMYEALDLLEVGIRVGMPTGRLKEKGYALGAPFHLTPETRRMVSRKGPLTMVATRSKTYPQMVALGTLDVAVVGSDALEGNPFASQVRVIERIPQVGSNGEPLRVVFAGVRPRGEVGLPKRRLLRVATPFPEWAQRVLEEQGTPHTIFAVGGGSEALVGAGIVDVVFDIVETGETLRANGLTILKEVGTLDLCVIGRKR